jgi:hypothetical protein
VRPLELDFERARRPSRITQGLLLAIALAFAGDVAWHHLQTRAEMQGIRERLAAPPSPSTDDRPLLKVATRPVSDEEYAFARETIARLSTPWNALFQALEAARIGSIAIVSVEPDPSARTVTVTGDARDYLAALSFVANLREQRVLRGVYLVRHEPSAAEPRLPLRFSVSASWGGQP